MEIGCFYESSGVKACLEKSAETMVAAEASHAATGQNLIKRPLKDVECYLKMSTSSSFFSLLLLS